MFNIIIMKLSSTQPGSVKTQGSSLQKDHKSMWANESAAAWWWWVCVWARAPVCVCLKGILLASSLKSLPPSPAIITIITIIIILNGEPSPPPPRSLLPPTFIHVLLAPASLRHSVASAVTSRVPGAFCVASVFLRLSSR